MAFNFEEVSPDTFEAKIKKGKLIKIVASKQEMNKILTQSDYKFKDGELTDSIGNPVFGIDGKPVTKNYPGMLAGSNIFLPRNKAALYKYYSEHK